MAAADGMLEPTKSAQTSPECNPISDIHRSAINSQHHQCRTRHSAFRTPRSAFRLPHSALRTPHSALRVPHCSASSSARRVASWISSSNRHRRSSISSRLASAGTGMGSRYTAAARQRGSGTMNRSQLLRTSRRAGEKEHGVIGTPVTLASSMTPSWTCSLGPRGPSGVTATEYPAFRCRAR